MEILYTCFPSLPKILGKRTKNGHFSCFWAIFPCQPQLQCEKETIGHVIKKSNMSHILNVSTSHNWPRSQSKIKTIGYAAKKNFIFLIKFCISHALTCPKFEKMDHNEQKYFNMTISVKFEHSLLPSSITRKNKNNYKKDKIIQPKKTL